MLKLCQICAARLSGCNDYLLFADSSELPVNQEFTKFLCDETCHLCLGILHRTKFADYKARLRATVKSWPLRNDQEISSLQILISVPAIITLIEKVIVAKIRELFPEVDVKNLHPASMKDILKIVCCSNLFENPDIMITSTSPLKIEMIFENKNFEESLVKMVINRPEAKNETSYKLKRLFKMEIVDTKPKRKKWKKDETTPQPADLEPVVNLSTIEKSFEIITANEILSTFEIVENLYKSCELSLQIDHEAIFIAGRYLKFSRKLPQTPWFIDNKRLHSDTSVEEIIGTPFQSPTGCEKTILSSSGREDVDVRTLGNGRPFIVEISKPRYILTTSDIESITAEVNKSSDVKIENVCQIDRQATKLLLEGETSKRKEYRAYCYSDKELAQEDLDKLELAELVLNQTTPIRVLHRRNVDVRNRTIHRCSANYWEGKSKNWFYLDLETQAGTYIKEFVHGDFGRTCPNVSEILNCEVDIVGLDVMNVALEWPPQNLIKNN